jgi:hypothetical protein
VRYTYFLRADEGGLDLDSDNAYRIFLKRLPKVLPLILKLVILATRPHHYDVYIRLKKRHRFVDICALQTYLGSDKDRELANMSRIIAGASKPILLIEYAKVRHWREPDIICVCPPKLRRGRKFANCPHLLGTKSHRPRWGFISTRLQTLGIASPFEN